MTNKEFMKELAAAFEKHDIINKTKNHTINELLYILRMEFEDDFCIGIKRKDRSWASIPSSKECFVPIDILSVRIDGVEYEEDIYEDKIYKCLTIKEQI